MITTAVCDSYVKECFEGVHQSGDTYKVALIKAGMSGNFGEDTVNYSELGSDEVSGAGYSAGGAMLANFSAAIVGGMPTLDFDNAQWPGMTAIDANAPRGFMIYNASRSNKAVMVGDFGSVFPVSNGTFTLPMDRPVRRG